MKQEAALRRRTFRSHGSSPLRLAIYTPDTFADGMDVDDDHEATESEIEDAADYSFDFESDDDPEDYEDDVVGQSSADEHSIPTEEHETIMAFDSPRAESPSPQVHSLPRMAPSSSMVPMTITICADPPPLPRLSSVRADDVLNKFQVPRVFYLGTPPHPFQLARGPLNREHLRAQAQLERDMWRY